ncbi:MAG: hypothetical protein GY714_02455 [Desulfobacterales bacterium]|nr:hypothetical protein [Desulfobacterales bacterium]
MELKELGKLAKLTIEADGDNTPFEVMFNPESYSEKFTTMFKKRENVNSGIEEYDYVKSMPQDFKLKIILDATGAAEFNDSYLQVFRKEQSVYNQVNEFLRLTWHPDGGLAPNFLKIKWGKFVFNCRLRDVDISYTLFNREGEPLRAELDATFIGSGEKNKSVYDNRFNGSKYKSSKNTSLKTTSSVTKAATSEKSNPAVAQSQQTSNSGNGIVIMVS